MRRCGDRECVLGCAHADCGLVCLRNEVRNRMYVCVWGGACAGSAVCGWARMGTSFAPLGVKGDCW